MLTNYVTKDQYNLCMEAKKVIRNNNLPYHNITHVYDILLLSNYFNDFKDVCPRIPNAQTILIMATFFHDIIHESKSDDIEELSCVLFEQMCDKFCPTLDTLSKEIVVAIILNTKSKMLMGYDLKLLPNTFKTDGKDYPQQLSEQVLTLCRIFNFYDWSILATEEEKYRNYCNKIIEEYDCWSDSKGRFEFLFNCLSKLEQFSTNFSNNKVNRLLLGSDEIAFNVTKGKLINTIRKNIYYEFSEIYNKQTVGVYAGSFDVPTIGHQWMIKDIHNQTDLLLVIVASNDSKNHTLTIDQRVALMKKLTENMNNVVVLSLPRDSLLYEFIKPLGVTTVYRGIRNPSDYEYESQMLMVNRNINSNVHTSFIMPPREYSEISSSMVKSLMKYQNNGDILKKYIPSSIFYDVLNLFNVSLYSSAMKIPCIKCGGEMADQTDGWSNSTCRMCENALVFDDNGNPLCNQHTSDYAICDDNKALQEWMNINRIV